MIKKFISYILVLYLVFINNSTIIFAENETFSADTELATEITTEYTENENQDANSEDNAPTLVAESAIMIDADSGIILYEKDCHKKLYPASITKIMTTLLALENSSLDETVTHSHNAVFGIGQGSSHIGMRENEQITMEDALNGIMLASANEVCMAVAEHIDGSVEKFVDRMNNKAKELGAQGTHFNNPHGFHDENHYTTAYDMSLFMQEAIKNPEFVKLISTTNYIIPETNIVNEKRYLANKNKMIQKWSNFYYPYCVGSKTGFTDQAGNTLVTYGKKDDINLITVVMKDQGTNTYVDTKALLEYGFSLYENKELVKKDSFTSSAKVIQKYEGEKRELGDVSVVLKNDISANVPKNIDTEKLDLQPDFPAELNAPVKKGDKVGTLKVTYDGKTIAEADLISNDSIDALSEEELAKEKQKEIFISTVKAILKVLGIIVGILVVGIAGLAIALKVGKKNKRRSRKNNKLKFKK